MGQEDYKQGVYCVQCMTMECGRLSNKSLTGQEVSLEQLHIDSLSDCPGGLYGVNVKGENVPDCGVSKGERSFSESVCVCVCVCMYVHVRTHKNIANKHSDTIDFLFISLHPPPPPNFGEKKSDNVLIAIIPIRLI